MLPCWKGRLCHAFEGNYDNVEVLRREGIHQHVARTARQNSVTRVQNEHGGTKANGSKRCGNLQDLLIPPAIQNRNRTYIGSPIG